MGKYYKLKNPNNPRPYRVYRPFWPHHAMMEFSVAVVVIAALLTLATFAPVEVGEKADPYTTPEHIKPEWYFLASYQFLKIAEETAFLGAWAPKTIGIAGQGALLLLLIFLPFIDRNPEQDPLKRPIALAIAVLCLIVMTALTLWGHYS